MSLAARGTPARRWLLHAFFLCLFALLLAVSGCTSESGDDSGESVDTGSQSGDSVTGTAPDNGATPALEEGDSLASGSGGFSVGTGGGGSGEGGEASVGLVSAKSVLLPGLEVTDFVVASTRRSGRTTMEYVLRLKISNASSTAYQSVVAELLSVPPHIVILDAIVTVGDIPGNATVLSQDTFTINVNLAQSTSFEDFVWRIDGDVKPPPPPPPVGEAPSAPGIYMNIDDLSIPGEATSKSHRDWIQLSEVTEGLRREGASGATSGRRTRFAFDGVEVTKDLDRSTPLLREAITEGTIFTEVKIDIIETCDSNPYTAYAITLTTARLDSLTLNGGQDEQRPVENLGFDYTRIETMYTPLNDDCSLDTPVFSIQDGDLLGL